ncbi:MAG: GIY-YIG nuclease family protein [Thermoanaerobaculia bacterium]|nr:GIY-YIG nuclease family protein [Thermoanaerobaculia bacterium]
MPRPNVQQYFLYLLTDDWRSVLYTGVTNSLERRIWEHKNQTFPDFTKRYNCKLLVHFEIYDDIKQAIAREKQIKRWTRAKKDALVEQQNPKWNDLAANWYEQRSPAGDPSPSTRLRMTEGRGTAHD